jgi:hypothetical protein
VAGKTMVLASFYYEFCWGKTMKNVCRPFYLFNDYLPPSKAPDANTRWKILGYYDDLQVGENLFGGNDNNIDFEKLWEANLQKNESLCGSYSLQTIYGFRDKDDDEFWDSKNTDDYPFLFFSMLQVGKSECDIKALEKAAELEKALNGNDIKSVTYYSVDYSDIIVVLLCKNYDDGARLIEELHLGKNEPFKDIKLNISYGYSFVAINMTLVNNPETLKNIKGNVKNVQIYIIAKELEKAYSTYDCMLDEIKKDGGEEYLNGISKQTLLGCNDLKFEIEELPWDIFLSFFKNKKGIYNHTSKIYQSNLIGVTTIIGTSPMGENKPQVANNSEDDVEENKPRLCRNLAERCKKWKLDNDNGGENSYLKRYFISIINSLGKYEVSPIHDYLFQTMLTQLNIIMDMAEQAEVDIKNLRKMSDELDDANKPGANELRCSVEACIGQIRNDFYASAYGFIREFSLYVQNSVRSDRQFTQAPDFDVRVYETPVKLVAFYNAYIYNMKEYLSTFVENNKSEHEYVFLAYPGITDIAKLNEKFRKISDTKRLFLMELPEIDTYRPTDLMTILGHEVAHNVGSGIRNREERAEITRKILTYLCVKYVRLSWRKRGDQENREEKYRHLRNDKLWEDITGIVESVAFEEEKQEKQVYHQEDSAADKVNKELYRHLNKRWYHREQVIHRGMEVMNRVAQHDSEEIWNLLLQREFFYYLGVEDVDAGKEKEKLAGDLKKWISEFCDDIGLDRKLNTRGVLNLLFYLYRECIADLICIKIHQISFRQYIELMVRELEYQGVRDFSRMHKYWLRTALVTVCMVNEEGYKWDNDADVSDDIFDQPHCHDFANGTIATTKECFSEEEQNSSENIDYLIANYAKEDRLLTESVVVEEFIKDTYVMKMIAKYLNGCLKKFNEFSKESNKGRQEKLERLQTMYNLFSENDKNSSISKLTIDIHKHIAEYYGEIREKNMGKLLKNGEERRKH